MLIEIKQPQPLRLEKTKSISLPLELELILCCAHTHMTLDQIEQAKALVRQTIDWQILIQKANYHKVLPLVYTNLKAICPEAIPAVVLNRLHGLFHLTVQNNMLLAGELVRVLGCLGEHEIVAVPYKGPALAHLIYTNIALRPSADLDILVQQQDVLKAKDLLIALGYQPKLEMTLAQEIAYLDSKTEHTYDFIHLEKRTTIELHWRIEPEYSTVIAPKHFWHHLEPATFVNTPIVNLPLQDWLPILCIHASRHIWERLIWLCDVAELLRTCPELDWQTMMGQADQLGYKRILLVGLNLAHHLLQVNLPPAILQKIAADRQVGVLTSKICSNLAQGIDADQEFLGSTLYHIRVRERFQDKLLYFRSFVYWLTKSHQ